MKKAKAAKLGISLALAFSLALNVFAASSTSGLLEAEQAPETAQPQAYTASPIVEEDVSKRGEYEKHFICEDSSYIAATYPYAVHEKDENGEWVDIDNSLAFKNNRIENQSAVNGVSFAPKAATAGQLARLEKDGHTLEWSLTGTIVKPAAQVRPAGLVGPLPAFEAEETALNATAKAEIEPEEEAEEPLTVEEANEEKMRLPKLTSSVLYEDAMCEGIDVRYTVIPGKVKEDIILNQPSGFESYTMHIDAGGLMAVKLDDNSVEFRDEDSKVVFTVSTPYMFDAAGAESFDISVEVEQNEENCTIVFTPDAAWLNASERVYPITIDPQNNQNDGANYDDTYVHEGDNISGSSGACTVCGVRHNKQDRMYAGIRTAGGSSRIHRAYFRIKDMPTLTTGSTINSANLKVWFTDNTNTGRAISLYKNLGSWNNDNLTWNNKPSSYEMESRPFNKDYLTFSSTNFLSGIRMMYSGENNNGFMLRYTDESKTNPDFNAFYTSNSAVAKRPERPLLTLSYQAPANIANGTYFVRNRKSGHYMDAEQDLTKNGNVIQYSFHGGTNQQWKVEKQSDGYYKLTNLYPQHNNKVLAVEGTTVANGRNVHVNTSNNSDAQRWAFFSNGDGSYRMMPKLGKQAMCISVNGGYTTSPTNLHMYDYTGASEQGWYLEKAENQDARFGTTISTGNFYEAKIASPTDYKWYKFTLPASSSSRLHVFLQNPQYPIPKTDPPKYEYARLKVEVFSGSANNPTVLEGVRCTGYDTQSVYVNQSGFSGSKTIYIKISSGDGTFSTEENYHLLLTFNSDPHGGEIEGWDYTGYKPLLLPIEYRLSDGMNQTWKTYNGVTYTYGDLFQQAINRWNSYNLKGDGTPLFRINNGLQIRTVKAFDFGDTGTNARNLYGLNFNIELNTRNFIGFSTPERAVDTIAHELGHSLGLEDLYISSSDKYYYEGTLIDNTDHLMYGIGDYRTLSGVGAARIHSDDKYGAKKIWGWASYVKITEEELYQQADLIVKGTVLSAKDYTGFADQNLNNMYSEVKFRVDEYIRGKAGSEITFLQMGQSISPMAVDPILQAGEECLLYLQYDDNGILHILGGPQGRFNILKADNRVINQLERFKYESVAEIPEITRPAWTKVSKEKTQFVNQVKMKQANILRVRREQ